MAKRGQDGRSQDYERKMGARFRLGVPKTQAKCTGAQHIVIIPLKRSRSFSIECCIWLDASCASVCPVTYLITFQPLARPSLGCFRGTTMSAPSPVVTSSGNRRSSFLQFPLSVRDVLFSNSLALCAGITVHCTSETRRWAGMHSCSLPAFGGFGNINAKCLPVFCRRRVGGTPWPSPTVPLEWYMEMLVLVPCMCSLRPSQRTFPLRLTSLVP